MNIAITGLFVPRMFANACAWRVCLSPVVLVLLLHSRTINTFTTGYAVFYCIFAALGIELHENSTCRDATVHGLPETLRQAYTLPENIFLDFMEWTSLGRAVAVARPVWLDGFDGPGYQPSKTG